MLPLLSRVPQAASEALKNDFLQGLVKQPVSAIKLLSDPLSFAALLLREGYHD
jgi:hypothetical protein